MSPEKVIEASGGVLWRPAMGGAEIEVALVHRPKYDDWSIPKGKLTTGEHPVVGAVREVAEETGHIGVPGRPLGQITYLKDGAPKRVRYWAMQVSGGEFEPNDEVDQLMWLPPREAQRHLLADRDRDVLRDVSRAAMSTWPCLVVRHASAGERSSWAGDDRERPLDGLGDQQSEALVPLLAAYGVQRVMSADVLRCLETIGPYAAAARLTVESEPLLSETGYGQQPDLAAERLVELLGSHVASVVCSQGRTIPGLILSACTALGAKPPEDPAVRKAGLFVLHMQAAPELHIAALERFDPVL
ncbi:MAG TPA: NUDIX hydrolase [Mycobacteriales bacterium]|jgi:8-oxo-dGTP diphosphatase|nr:NUDIX hydrolase [Mycobacteriales bacterium]